MALRPQAVSSRRFRAVLHTAKGLKRMYGESLLNESRDFKRRRRRATIHELGLEEAEALVERHEAVSRLLNHIFLTEPRKFRLTGERSPAGTISTIEVELKLLLGTPKEPGKINLKRVDNRNKEILELFKILTDKKVQENDPSALGSLGKN